MCDNVVVVDGLWWDEEDVDYIRRRSDRYPAASNIEPEWTLEAATDPRRIVLDPDPKSRIGAIRLIGYSPSAGFVLTVIVDPVNKAGITAWKTRGADLRSYLEGERAMTDRDIRARRDAIRAEYAAEEAAAAEAEAVENEQAVVSVRVPATLAETLKARAAAEHIPTSALIRRILTQAVHEPSTPVLTVEQVEEIARRIYRESA
jgi:predicted DNA binding CopG/RHH family protein